MPSHPISLRPILILCYHLHLGFPTGLQTSVSPPKSCMHLSSPTQMPQACQLILPAVLLHCFIPAIPWSHCSPVYSSMELGVELMSLEPSSKFLRFVISPGGSEPGPETNAEQINTQHRLVFRATGKKLKLHLRSYEGVWEQHMYSSTNS